MAKRRVTMYTVTFCRRDNPTVTHETRHYDARSVLMSAIPTDTYIPIRVMLRPGNPAGGEHLPTVDVTDQFIGQ